MKKIISISLAITTICWMAGVVAFAPVSVGAVAVVDGDLIRNSSAEGMAQFDIYIVKVVGDKKFKRLVLSPHVFESYEHFDKNGNGNNWDDVIDVDQATMDAQTTTDLVREDGVDNVYRLYAAEGADTGTRYWLDMTATAFLAVFDADAIYTINATDVAGYTAGVNVTDASAAFPPTDGVGDVTLSLASDNPAAGTLPPNGQGITFMSLRIAGSGTVNQITFKRMGAGATGDFGDLYIYEDGVRLTSGRSISSATSKATFINLGLSAPTTVELVADLSSATAGNVNYFSIENSSDVTGTATVGGTFPLTGNPMGVSGTDAGTVTVIRAGAGSRNVTIGGLEQEISQFKASIATEGAHIHRVQLFNNGDADNPKITNLKVKDNTGATVATATNIGSDGYVAFVFDTPYYIKKGDNEIFRVYADIGAVKPDRTIKLYIELSTDILAVGTTYGYGMAATVTSFDGSSSSEYVTITCKGGDLTLNKIGPNADNIGTATDDTVFLEYSMTAAADVTIKRTELIFCHDDAGSGTYQNASSSAGADITDIKIVDKDTGTVIAGPKDGTAFNDGTRSTACPGNKAGMYEAFTDTIDVVSGETYTYQVTGDIDITATDSGMELTAGDIVKFILYSYATMVGTSGTVNYLKYTGTTDAVDDSAIVPSSDISGEEMTLEASALVITLAASPSGSDGTNDEKVYIAGQTGVEAVGLIFTSGAASDITINSIQLTGYIAEATGGTWTAGKEDDYVKDTIANVYIYDDTNGGLVPGSTAKGFTSGTNFENVDFTGLSWTIPAGEAYTLMVQVDISSAAPASASSADTWISFDIADISTDVSAIDKDGNSVDGTADAPNGGTSTNTDFGVADYGSLVIDQASDTPDKSIIVMGTDDNEVSKFKLTGTYEAWQIEKFSILLDDGGGAETEDRDNFSGISLKYQTESQWDTDNWTISGQKTFGANASLAFAFSGTNRIYVPKDNDSFVTVLADIQGYNGGNGAKSKKAFKIYNVDGSTDAFKTYGDQSGKQLSTYSTDSAAASDFNLHFIARSKPVFAKVAWGGGETELARFSITAVGEDIIFKNGDFDNATLGGSVNFDGSTAPVSAFLEFDVIASGSIGASTSFYLYDWTETIISSVKNAGVWNPATTEFDSDTNHCVATIGFHFEEGNLTRTIPGGATKEFHVNIDGGDITDFDNSDEYIYMKLTGDEGGDLATSGLMDSLIIYDDDTAEEGIDAGNAGSGDPEERFMMPGGIKNIGPLPITFRTLRGTVAP